VSKVKIIAIDPDKRNIDKFKKISMRQIQGSNFLLENMAIWEFDGSIPFAFEDTNTANNRFSASSNMRVSCFTLNTLLADHNDQDILIKIDVQGYELEVLSGAEKVLRKNNVLIIVEMDELALRSRGSGFDQLLNQLESFGYRAWNISNGRFFQYQDLLDLLAIQECVDLLFLPFPGRDTTKSRNI
jgi:FkbM family methyltransferase